MQRPAKFRRCPFADLFAKPIQVRLAPLTLVTVMLADLASAQKKASNNSLGEVVENDGEVKFGLELDLSVETVTSIPMAPQSWLAPDRYNTNIIRRITYPQGESVGVQRWIWWRVAVRNTNRTTHSANKPPDH